MRKKGQLGGLQAFIATLIVSVVLIGAMFFIVQEFLEQEEFTDTAITITNETVTQAELIAGTKLDGTAYLGAHTYSVSLVSNGSIGPNIDSANWTIDAESGLLSNDTSEFTDFSWNVTYSFSVGETAYEGMNDTVTELLTLPSLLGLIILIAVIGIVLAIVFNVIPGGRVSGA